MRGYQALYLIQDAGCSTWKENTLNKHSKQDFSSISLLVVLVWILKVVRNFYSYFVFQFYAFYKQAKEGECSESEPGFWDVVRKAKW